MFLKMWTVPVHEELRLAVLFLKRHEPSFGAQLHQSSEWNGYAELGSVKFGAGVSLRQQAHHLKEKNLYKVLLRIRTLRTSVVDMHHFDADADPDSTYHPDADPDSDFYLMRIRMRIQDTKMMRIHNTAQNPQDNKPELCFSSIWAVRDRYSSKKDRIRILHSRQKSVVL